MSKLKTLSGLLLIFVFAAACGPIPAIPTEININIQDPTQDVNQIVASTFAAMTVQAAQVPALASSTPQAAQPSSTTTTSGTDSIPTNTPPGGQSGSIAGDLSYPSSGLPAMTIVAFHVGGGPNDYYYTTTQQGQNHYQLDNLPPGQYTVVAYSTGGGGYSGGLAAGYSQAVPCGLDASCSDHSLIVVAVSGGTLTNNVNPQDWYAPEGTFPVYPLP
jgi:hypothetical protein